MSGRNEKESLSTCAADYSDLEVSTHSVHTYGHSPKKNTICGLFLYVHVNVNQEPFVNIVLLRPKLDQQNLNFTSLNNFACGVAHFVCY